jgi:16S rRNA (cytosine967-C5)-methyltransferase
MTPAARLLAAIQVLESADSLRRPLDAAIRDYFATRRYAGSKDRSAVSDLVFTVARRRGDLDVRLTEAGVKRTMAHRVALVAGPAGFGGDDTYAPPALTPESLAGLERAAALPEGRPRLPGPFEGRLAQRFRTAGPGQDDPAAHEQMLAEVASLLEHAPVDLRVAGDREVARAALAELGLVASPTPWSPLGLRLVPEGNPSNFRGILASSELLRSGGAEVQDEGSQLAALFVQASAGHTVLDRCAGAGGKSLALADLTFGKAKILACDVNAARLQSLEGRVRTDAARKAITTEVVPPRTGRLSGRTFDRVLCDVPCTGSGTVRRAPDLPWRLSESELAETLRTQAAILDECEPLVAPRGRLVYVTCSLFEEENDAQAKAFLARNPNFHLVPAQQIWASLGLPNGSDGAAPAFVRGGTLLLSPRRSQTDGFFVAVFERD